MQNQIGVIGLGNMGSGIAANFIGHGTGVVAWDVAEAARNAFAGRDGATIMTPGDMAKEVQTIVFVVPASPAIEACLEGADGILANAEPGMILCDFTTSYPDDTRRLAERAAGEGLGYLDAGMTGGAQGAAAGTISLMVGGERALFEEVEPMFEQVSAKIFYMGSSGAGHTAKLLQNMVTHTIFLATCEAGHIGARAGIDLGALIDVFNASNARSFASENRFPRHILSDTWDGRSRVFNLHKDLTNAVRMADEAGLPAAFGETTRAILQRAVDRGMEESDFTLLYKEFENLR